MSDNDDRDSGKMGTFLLGFLVGVLVSLAGGSVFFGMQFQRAERAAMEAQMMADVARQQAEEALMRAEMERDRARKADEAEKKVIEKAKE